MAKEKKPRKQRVTVAEKIAKINPVEFSKIPGTPEGMKQLSKYYNTLRQGFKRRMAQIRNAGKYSFAGEQIEPTLVDKPASGLIASFKGSKATKRARNALISEIVKYQNFFNFKTSTLSGISEVEKAQDERIFEKSEDKTSMNEDERKYFWRVYNEYIHSDKNPKDKYYSKTIQQTLQEAIFNQNMEEVLEKAEIYGIENDLGTQMLDAFSYHLAKVNLMLQIKTIEQAMGEEDELDILTRDWD